MNKKILVTIIILFNLALSGYANKPEKEILRLATTTSLYESGLLSKLELIFEKRYNVDLHIISAGTGIAMRHGMDGDVDVILVHDRDREDAFVKNGYGVNRRCIAYNFFLIVGPNSDPAGIKGMAISDAFVKLMERGIKQPNEIKFVSRGDDSGTHFREIEIWRKAGKNYNDVKGSGIWYIETGAGMGATLRMANEKSAYTLVDTGTFLSFVGKLGLVPIIKEGEELFNPYGLIAVNPVRHPHVNFEMAINFINFLMADDIQKVIGEFKYNEHRGSLFYPLAKDCKRMGCKTWELCKTPLK